MTDRWTNFELAALSWRFSVNSQIDKERNAVRTRALDAIHETALDLHEAGFIDKRRMQLYDALCLVPIGEYPAERIRNLRLRYQLSQAVFAAILNTSLSTVRQWEIGQKRPGGTSLKLLDLLDRKGLEALI
ncbi:helix-turn-helix domain-containing protein [Zeimonas arvi]|uniref:Helix-turn-helix domain-containing protein n=1 Tax=Zeimonas arvi TaxID=2498847 RepID=A0A5C8NXH1_9BURK|nr:helix-turn-helix domain-containing protein [Zeimonas arvi]